MDAFMVKFRVSAAKPETEVSNMNPAAARRDLVIVAISPFH
jgi:hypothetical protein